MCQGCCVQLQVRLTSITTHQFSLEHQDLFPSRAQGTQGEHRDFMHTPLVVGGFSLNPTVLTQKGLDLMRSDSQVQIFPPIAVYWTQLKPKCPN